MKPASAHPLIDGFRRALRPPDRRAPWLWCEEHLIVDETSPFPGKWRSDNSPWVREVMEEGVRKRRVTVMCSAQSAKTQTILGLACFAIAEDPGPALWVMAAQDEARDFMRDRMTPTFGGCRPVSDLFMRVERRTLLFASMPFYLTGSNSKSKLQSKPIRWLFLDEVRNYPAGAIHLALKRTRTYFNAHEFIISTPDLVGDEVDLEFKKGDQRKIHTVCPVCAAVELLTFERLRWDDNPTTHPEGRWSIDALARTIRLVCSHCDHVWHDAPTERRRLAAQARFVAGNPLASEDNASFHWNALLPPWVPWKSVVEEFLGAVAAAKADPPELEPLKAFYNETLGLPWETALGVIDNFSFLDERRADYGFGDAWSEEVGRFMAADKQLKGGEHYWWLIRAFAYGGKSRLIAYGKCYTYEELEQIRESFGVRSANAMIDVGFRKYEVFRFCLRFGWKAFRGEAPAFFTSNAVDPKDGREKRVRRVWRKTQEDSAFGMPGKRQRVRRLVSVYGFASPTLKDFLAEFTQGFIGEWTIPKEVGREYLEQMTAERRVAVEDSKGRTNYEWRQFRKDNHFYDCEQMVLVAAIITRLVQSGVVRAPARSVDTVAKGRS